MILNFKKMVLLLLGIASILIAYLAPSAYRKAEMDREVDRLCSVDGGINVFEKVNLPAEKFDQFGTPKIPLSTSKSAQNSAFVLDATVVDIVKSGPEGNSKPTLHRTISKAIRVSDKKILGIAVGYYRFGGDPAGPWHPSHYAGCTEEPGKQLIRAIFIRSS